MDNRTVDIVSVGDESLELALKLIWCSAPGGKASHFKIVNLKEKTRYCNQPTTHHYTELFSDPEGVPTLILMWHADKDAEALPYPIDFAGSLQFVKGWLNQANYGKQPDHDGDNDKGWRVFTESWGHVAGYSYSFVAIQPVWAMYGK